MSELKLFKINGKTAAEIEGGAVVLEKSLQTLIEVNLETFLGVRFLASEYSTGPKHGGRIDTLGLDENGSPVIIEYKRATNENVINQGLYYLDWLLDHQAELKLLVMEKLGPQAAAEIDWTGPRLICIAGDFTKYDLHGVQQINRNIDLIRHRKFGDDLLALELVHTVTSEVSTTAAGSGVSGGGGHKKVHDKSVHQAIADLPADLADVFEALRAHVLALGDDIVEKTLKYYIAFRKIKNFVCVVPQAKALVIYLKLDPKTVQIESDFMRDVSDIGHWATGDLEATISSMSNFEKAKPLIQRAYEEN
jgi:predicted transport protein